MSDVIPPPRRPKTPLQIADQPRGQQVRCRIAGADLDAVSIEVAGFIGDRVATIVAQGVPTGLDMTSVVQLTIVRDGIHMRATIVAEVEEPEFVDPTVLGVEPEPPS